MPQRWNSSRVFRIAGQTDDDSRCVDCAERRRGQQQQASSRPRVSPRRSRAGSARSVQAARPSREPHGAPVAPLGADAARASSISRIGMCQSSRSSTVGDAASGVLQIVRHAAIVSAYRSGRRCPARSACSSGACIVASKYSASSGTARTCVTPVPSVLPVARGVDLALVQPCSRRGETWRGTGRCARRSTAAARRVVSP